jgi:hypothetical protein
MPSSKKSALIFSFIMAGVVAWPVTENLKKKPSDNFPLSYYPMFSFKRDADYTLNYIVGYDAGNKRYYIPYRYIGSGGFNQARRQLNRKVKKNEGGAVLQKVRNRIIKRNEPPYNQLTKIQLVRGRFNFDKYFISGNKEPEDETILAFKMIEQ